jgi:TonB family protein
MQVRSLVHRTIAVLVLLVPEMAYSQVSCAEVFVRDIHISGYPPIARTKGEHGVVRLEVDVDKEGNVTAVTRVDGPHLLRQIAEDVKAWRFRVPAPTTLQLSFNFEFAGKPRNDHLRTVVSSSGACSWNIQVNGPPPPEPNVTAPKRRKRSD